MRLFKFILFVILLPVLWNIMFIIWCNEIKDSRSLMMVGIPESTKAFLDSIGNRIIDGVDDGVLIIEVDSIDSGKWNNKTDYGKDNDSGLYCYNADSLFVIYSDTDDMELISKVHGYAVEAIGPLNELMGLYIYPHMDKGRKLPIYLCRDKDVYQDVCSSLSEQANDFSKTWGLCINQYCGTDVITLGIALNYGSIKESDNTDIELKSTLWHEMNHHVFFQAMDISKEVTPYMWVYEGLAEYFGSQVNNRPIRLSGNERNNALYNTLMSEFKPYIFNYTGGEIFYNCIEEQYGMTKVKEFIQCLYNRPIQQAFESIGTNWQTAENEWKHYLQTKYL